jgi:hypothetical protein
MIARKRSPGIMVMIVFETSLSPVFWSVNRTAGWLDENTGNYIMGG